MGIVFVSGVHGVGKTTTCQQAVADIDWSQKSASSIIRQEKATAIQDESKTVKDIPGNQELLITGLRRFTSNSRPNLLLDGHFTLLSESEEIVEIDKSVFEKMSLSGIVLIQDQPEKIDTRLRERDLKSIGTERIGHHQVVEEKHAKEVAKILSIPLFKVDAFDSSKLAEVLRSSQ